MYVFHRIYEQKMNVEKIIKQCSKYVSKKTLKELFIYKKLKEKNEKNN